MRNLSYRLGLRLARIPFVRSAIDERADLHSSGKLFTVRFLVGLILMPLSFIVCWPGITVLGGIAVHLHKPLVLAIGGPILYLISAIAFALGVSVAGKTAATVFFRWRARVWVEWLLSKGADGPEEFRNPNPRINDECPKSE